MLTTVRSKDGVEEWNEYKKVDSGAIALVQAQLGY